MCGIAGFFSKKDLSQDKKDIVFEITKRLFEETKIRGTDSSGFSYINKFNKLTTVKGPISSPKMVEEEKFNALKQNLPNNLIAHCRQATVGTYLDNFNNHPLVVNKELALIHNGGISNHKDLREHYKLDTKGLVDSEVIPLIIHKHAKRLASAGFPKVSPLELLKAINMTTIQMEGGYSCAMIAEHLPNYQFLFNHNNPLVLAACVELETVFFASTLEIMKKAIQIPETFVKKFGIFNVPKYHWSLETVSEDTLTAIYLDKAGEVQVSGYELNSLLKWKYGTTKNGYGNSRTFADLKEPVKPEPLKVKKIFSNALDSDFFGEPTAADFAECLC